MSLYDSIMVKIFWWCVDFLDAWAKAWGLTYEELNIYLFILLHPAVTLVLLILLIKSKRAHKRHIQQLLYNYGE